MLVLDGDLQARILDHFGPTFLQATDGASEVARESVVEVLETSVPSGREYRDPETGEIRRASAPGQPPADPDDFLAGSWEVRPATREQDRFTGSTYSTSGISPVLEFGSERIAPRPHARPAHVLAADKLRGDLGQVLR